MPPSMFRQGTETTLTLFLSAPGIEDTFFSRHRRGKKELLWGKRTLPKEGRRRGGGILFSLIPSGFICAEMREVGRRAKKNFKNGSKAQWGAVKRRQKIFPPLKGFFVP